MGLTEQKPRGLVALGRVGESSGPDRAVGQSQLSRPRKLDFLSLATMLLALLPLT